MIGSARTDDIEAGVSLGGFALERRIGEGGMAEVWLGRHPGEGLPAAIKVITRQRADDESYREGLRREVRAVAALDHPHIVPVFDTGTVDESSAAASGGALVAGSPWLAMLYAEHGELRRLPSPMTWPLLREVLLQILDGLAHAHARGVIHRDLKPENVLLHIESDRLRLMLTDFGIAHVIDAEQSDGGASANSAGTPHYMAPEQFMGRWRDYGPWTDLYALGCMAFELATGQPPFTDRTLFGIAQKHLTEPIPPLISPHPMPVGFEQWIRRMMQRAPHERFQSAADAAWGLGRLAVPSAAATRAARLDALERLGAAEPGQATEISGAHGVALADTRDLSEAFEPGFTLACVVDPDGLVGGHPCALPDPESPFDDLGAYDLPPMPQTWFVDMPERPLLKGVGLGLFGVRALPFVDRDHQRDTLWQALRDVRRHRHSRLVVLEGLEGSGKSRLAEWFAQRASEVGAAEPIHVRHSAMDAPGDAFAAAVEGWFRGQELDQQRLEERIAQRLTNLDPERARRIAEVDAPALARFVRPDGKERLQAHQQTPQERYGAVHAWVHALARKRPVILLLDDVQWCEDSLALIEWMLHSAPEPVLIVATLRTDLCCEGTPEAVVVQRLEASERAQRVPVGPLADADHGRVIRDLLGLHPLLAEQLLLHSGGNPLFATQIVTDWIERAALEPTNQGYMCNGTALIDVPPDLPTVAGRRFDRLAGRFPAPAAVHLALQVAAALGHAVQIDEWHAALEALGDPVGAAVPEGLLDALYDAGLAAPARDGWIFGHGFARDALTRQAEVDGRWKAINRACAAAVRDGRAPDERRARHLMKAGDDEATIDALLEAAQNRMDASEYNRAISLSRWRACVIDGMELADDDVRRIASLPIQVEALRFLGRPDEAAELLTRFRRFPFGHEHPRLLAEAERLRGGQAFATGAVGVMSEAYSQAIELYKVAGDARGEARARHGMGWSLMYLGRSEAAERAFVASHAVAARAGIRIEEGWALQGIGASRAFGLRDGARAPLLAAREVFREIRLPAGLLGCRIFLAEVERQAGDLKAAWEMAASAVDIGRTIGSHIMHFGQAAMASIALDLGDPAGAQRIVDELEASGAIGRIERVHRQFAPSVRVVLAKVAAAHGRADEVRLRLSELEAERSRTFLQPGSCAALMQLAETCEAQGLPADAARWWRLAADYYERISPERRVFCLGRIKAITG